MSAHDDLFKTDANAWDTDPKATFEQWLSQQPGRGISRDHIRISSAEVYRAQWGRFVAWIEQKSIKLSEVDSVVVTEFLESLGEGEDATKNRRPQRDRYRKLIQRVLADLIENTAEVGFLNPAAQALREEGAKWKEAEGNLPTSFLQPSERALLATHLISPITAEKERDQWREARDRAIVGLCVGAGLKVAEIVPLTVNCIDLRGDHWITLRDKRSQFSHRTRPFDYAAQALTTWLHHRERMATEGNLLFPSDIKTIIKNSKPVTSIHPSTIVRITESVIAESGVKALRGDEHRASPQTLRNSYAAELFEQGESPEMVAERMGFVQIVSAERLFASWQMWRNS
jgi:site-specific recombinase XerD